MEAGFIPTPRTWPDDLVQRRSTEDISRVLHVWTTSAAGRNASLRNLWVLGIVCQALSTPIDVRN